MSEKISENWSKFNKIDDSTKNDIKTVISDSLKDKTISPDEAKDILNKLKDWKEKIYTDTKDELNKLIKDLQKTIKVKADWDIWSKTISKLEELSKWSSNSINNKPILETVMEESVPEEQGEIMKVSNTNQSELLKSSTIDDDKKTYEKILFMDSDKQIDSKNKISAELSKIFRKPENKDALWNLQKLWVADKDDNVSIKKWEKNWDKIEFTLDWDNLSNPSWTIDIKWWYNEKNLVNSINDSVISMIKSNKEIQDSHMKSILGQNTSSYQ